MRKQLTLAPILASVAAHDTSRSKNIDNNSKPNILLLLPDQWRFDWDGRDGGGLDLKLHHFTELARRGTRFLHAFTPSPLCAPSRACLASGREYDKAGVATNFASDYNINITTFYSILRDEGGYHTMTVGKDDLTKATQLGTAGGHDGTTGLYHQHELGFTEGRRCSGKMDVVQKQQPHEMYGHWLKQQQRQLSNGTIINGWDAHRLCMTQFSSHVCSKEFFPEEWYEDTWVAQQAMELLTTAPEHQPWFLQVNFAGPHPPFLVTPQQRQVVEQRKFPAAVDNKNSQSKTCAPVNQPQSSYADRCDYAAELEHLDTLVGQILETIKDQRQNTILCFSSDHGEMLGDHGLMGKTYPWQGSVSVPLACTGPGIQQNVSLEKPFVSTMDLAATFLDYAGVYALDNAPSGMASQSLRGLLEAGTDSTYRPFLSSGMQNYPFHQKEPSLSQNDVDDNNHRYTWRMVVESRSGLKYICCIGDRCSQHSYQTLLPYHRHYSTGSSDEKNVSIHQFLFNITEDPFDMNPLNEVLPQEMKRLRSLLPKDFPCHPPDEQDSVALQDVL